MPIQTNPGGYQIVAYLGLAAAGPLARDRPARGTVT